LSTAISTIVVSCGPDANRNVCPLFLNVLTALNASTVRESAAKLMKTYRCGGGGSTPCGKISCKKFAQYGSGADRSRAR
jgi:hypothetical protein